MKILPWICGLSLAANAALVGHSWLARAPDRDSSAAVAKPAGLAALPTAAPAPVASPDAASAFVRADTPLAKLLDGSDLHAMKLALEASGLTEADAKAVIRTRIRDSQKAARDAINQRRSPADETWWYDDQEARRAFEDRRRADRKVLDDGVTQTLASIFGPEPETPAQEPIHHQARFLPAGKQLAVTQILQDYDAMQREGRPRNYNGPELPSDTERRRFIEEERRKDIAAVLSPEELREYDMRHSPVAQQLRWNLAGMKPSREEYAAIFDSLNVVETNYNTRGGGEFSQEFWRERQEAQKLATAELKTALGEERFIDYALSNDHESRQTFEAVRRFNLPETTTRDLWKLRQQAGLEGEAVFKDGKLSNDEKKARIAEIGRRSREQIERLLGAEAAAELKRNDYVEWASEFERHRVRIYNETGGGSRGFSL